MINSIINLHSYLVVNGAIMLSYLLARLIVNLPFIKTYLSQYYKLRLARYCFVITIITFLLSPYLTIFQPLQHAQLELTPLFHHATHMLASSGEAVTMQVSLENMPLQISLKTMLISLWIAGILLFSYRYCKTLATLKKIRHAAFCQHKINNIHILFSGALNSPFCWSILHKHFIALPQALLTRPEDKHLTIRHESQHLRHGDTYWLQLMQVIQVFCFWNPFLKLWMQWLSELQEFSCDEEMIIRRKISPVALAQCLVNAARESMNHGLLINGVISINSVSQSILYRRVNMLFAYKNQKRRMALITAYAISFLLISGTAIAFKQSSLSNPLTAQDISSMIQQSTLNQPFRIKATPEVVAMINKFRHQEKEHTFMSSALERMKLYKPTIQQSLKMHSLPNDLLALPLVESGYRPLEEKVNPVRAAGVWQIIPSTAARFGLVINNKRDDRLDTQLSTQAAITYLNLLYAQFHDWKLAVIAYEIGEGETERLINVTGSRDAWTIARSPSLPKKYKNELKNYLALFDASVIILHHPSVITK